MAHTLDIESAAIPVIAGRPALEPVRLSGHEGVNSLFEYELLLKTPDALNLGASGAMDFDLDSFIGREISCLIELDGAGEFIAGATGGNAGGTGAGVREINALITDAQLWGEEGRHVQYKLTLRPWLHLATLTTDCKIFQNKTVVQILDELFADYAFPVDKHLSETYPEQDFQVQFNESDFAFFERLCQERGISYHFDHSDGKHRLVLTDSMGAYLPMQSAAYQQVEYHAPGWKVDAEYIHSFVPHHQLTSGKYTSRDYDYTRPKADLTVKRADPRPTGQADQEVYQWHDGQAGSHYVQPRAGRGTNGTNEPLAEGDRLALLRMQALRTHGARATGSGQLRGMAPGFTFQLQKHPREAANVQYLVLDSQFLIENIAQESQGAEAAPHRKQQWRVEVDFTAHPITEPLRPELSRHKPHTRGPQVALVVGPEDENLWTDELARIKVQFPWDRIGQKNQHSTCWLRVSSPWAGNELGGVHVPRIGQEVIVDFIGGDLDLPICTGRVHNQMNLPPWKLPDQAALSGFRSRELVKGGGNSSGGRSNHFILDDTDQKIQAQLKSDHQSSSLSLGHITRIDGNAGRQDARGEGFELRTDAHGAIRATQGLLITTEARPNAKAHLLDSGETRQRLVDARDLHDAGAQEAQKNKAQEGNDQAEVAKSLKEQNDAVQGEGAANVEAGQFPELAQPHLVLASPAGIETTSQFSTHIASVEHTAITSGKHTSITSGDSLLGVALQAIKLFAAQKGIKIVAAQADIDIQALKTCINLLAKDEITIRADKIRIEAKTELLISGGGSYARYKGGSIESGTTGPHIRHASVHGMVGPSSGSRPSLPDGLKPGKGQLELTHRYANNHGLKGADYKVTDSAGQVKTGKLDDKGFAAVSGLAPGGARIELGEDPRNPWDEASYFGQVPRLFKPGADAPTPAAPNAQGMPDMLGGLMKQAGGGFAGMTGAALASGSLSGIGKGLADKALGSEGGAVAALAGAQATPLLGRISDVAGAAAGGNLSGLARTAVTSVAGGAIGKAVDPLTTVAAQWPPGIVQSHTTV
ncbi:type VI secretion system secreted protein VgrG [Variovorax boronicumulans]|uniref:type VI secretion system Vgr family protein n=1 Tax=Variovorax boronicumulans TaxID=436515 RepID=UPI002780E506|nr:type VI secretion system tip protein TssI/VgrG [Variovorax boronicumulans]MDQ0035420.1 type VI secretion system secreted protein VgrG [Variovorax boronicumulans]